MNLKYLVLIFLLLLFYSTSSTRLRVKRQVNGISLSTTISSTTSLITNNSTETSTAASITTHTTASTITFKTTPTTVLSTSTTSILVTTNTQSKTTTNNKPFSFYHVINLLGPRKEVDIVFLLGRNKGIGKVDFYHKGRPLTAALLKQYASVHKDYARIAYVTFASNSSIDYDDISNSTTPLDKCQMFPSVQQERLPLDTVAYVNEDEATAAGIAAGIKEANQIFKAGRNQRPNSKQILFIVTDADFKNTKISEDPNPLVTVFGIGLGRFYSQRSLRSLVPIDMNLADIISWINLTNTFMQPTSFANPLHTSNVSESICSSLQSDLHYNANNTACFCDVDYGVVRLQCKSEFVDVLDESPGMEKRSCEENSTFVSSCVTNSCTNNTCKRSSGTCQDNILDCHLHCSNDATCVNTGEFLFCRCVNGFYGPRCLTNEDDCRFSDVCVNNGQCVDDGIKNKNFICNCPKEYGGGACEIKLPPSTPSPDSEIINSPLSITAAVIASGIVGGIILLIIVIGVIICTAFHITRKKVHNKPYSSMKSEMGTSMDAGGSVSKWSAKKKNNLSVGKLWKQRTLRGFKERDGMPTVPWRTAANLTGMELQNVDQEETIIENETIHDNRPVMENWKIYLNDLIENGHITKGMMVNVFSKEIIATDDWEFNWSEVYTLDTVFGTDTNVTVQDEDYYLRAPEDGVACGKSGSQSFQDNQNLLAIAKTKKYLIIGIVALSENQNGSECKKEVQLIMNHAKSEGY